MSDLEKFEFCGQLCRAARLMGIGLREETKGEAGSSFAFHDPVGQTIYGDAALERKDALFNACKVLQDHLCVKT